MTDKAEHGTTGGADGGPDGTDLEALAEQVAEQAARIAGLETEREANRAAVQEAARLTGEVERLAGAVAGASGASRGRSAEHPRIWPALSRENYAEGLRDLGRWVTDIFLVTYPQAIQAVPYCWPVHPQAIMELDTLYWSWLDWAIVPAGEGRGREAADWHRMLPDVQQRLGTVMSACISQKDHVPERVERHAPAQWQNGQHWPDLLFIEAIITQAAEGGAGS